MAYVYTRNRDRQKRLKHSECKNWKDSFVFYILSFLAIIPSLYFVLKESNYFYAFANYLVFYCALVILGKKGGLFDRFICAGDKEASQSREDFFLFELNDSFHIFEEVSLHGRFVEKILVGPSGIFVISRNKSNGIVNLYDNKLFVDGESAPSELLKDIWIQFFTLRDYLAQNDISGVPIIPVLFFCDAHVQIADKVHGTLIVDRKSIVSSILNNNELVTRDLVRKTIAVLSKSCGVKSPVQVVGQDPGAVGHGRSDAPGAQCPVCGYERAEVDNEFYEPGLCPQCGRDSRADPVAGVGSMSILLAIRNVLVRAGGVLFSSSVLAPGGAVIILWLVVFGVSIYRTQVLVSEHSEINLANDTVAGPAAENDTLPTVAEGDNATSVVVTGTGRPGEANGQVFTESVFTDNASLPEKGGSSLISVAKDVCCDNPVSPDADSLPAEQNGSVDAEDEGTRKNSTLRLYAEYFERSTSNATSQKLTGVLTVFAREEAMFWFVGENSDFKSKKYHLLPGEKVEVELFKGGYTVYFDTGGKKRSLSMSFISDFGQLDL